MDPLLRARRGRRHGGAVCIYQATDEAALRRRAERADLPIDEVVRVADDHGCQAGAGNLVRCPPASP